MTRSAYYAMSLTRWDNVNLSPSAGQPDAWSFSSAWRSSACLCADGGTQNNTTTAGAAGSYTAHVAVAGEYLGLMMATGPGRGRADIFVDGKHKTIVDTYAAANGNRVYVWDSGRLSRGRHTVTVVNQATPGRPRIDVNAMTANLSVR